VIPDSGLRRKKGGIEDAALLFNRTRTSLMAGAALDGLEAQFLKATKGRGGGVVGNMSDLVFVGVR